MTDHLAAAIDSLDVARKAHNPQIAAQAFDTAETEALIASALTLQRMATGLSAALQEVAQELRTANLIASAANAGAEMRLAYDLGAPSTATMPLQRVMANASRQATEALGL